MDKFVKSYLRYTADHAKCTLQGDYKINEQIHH